MDMAIENNEVKYSSTIKLNNLIFSLNIHSFIFTITSIIVALALIFPDHNTQWVGYLYLLTPIYQLIGAKKLYQHRWINTFFKLTLVWFLYGFVWYAFSYLHLWDYKNFIPTEHI